MTYRGDTPFRCPWCTEDSEAADWFHTRDGDLGLMDDHLMYCPKCGKQCCYVENPIYGLEKYKEGMTTCPVCNEQSTVEAWLRTEEVVLTGMDEEGRPEPWAKWAKCPKCGKLCHYGKDIAEGGLVEMTDDTTIY